MLKHRNKLALILSLNQLILRKLSKAGPRQPEKDFIPGYRNRANQNTIKPLHNYSTVLHPTVQSCVARVCRIDCVVQGIFYGMIQNDVK